MIRISSQQSLKHEKVHSILFNDIYVPAFLINVWKVN